MSKKKMEKTQEILEGTKTLTQQEALQVIDGILAQQQLTIQPVMNVRVVSTKKPDEPEIK